MFRHRLRLISAALALVSIGLFASLLPQTSFVSRSSGEAVDAIGPIWPDQSVEQVLDDVDVISEIRIWARARLYGGEAPIVASLFTPLAQEPVRQLRFNIAPSNVLEPHVLVFPPYLAESGEKLVLQLWVSSERENNAFFGTSEHGHVTPLVLNRQPTDHGPLAYEFIWRGTGWQAALEGSTPDRARLAGALAAAALAVAIAVLSHPRVSRPLRNTTPTMRIVFLSLVSRGRLALQRLRTSRAAGASPAETPTARHAFYVFPWLIPAFAILHYLANNLLLFRLSESIAVFAVTMAVITAAFMAFRLALKNTAVAAVITGLLGTAFFSYGHIHIALGESADHRYLLGLGAPLLLTVCALTIPHPELARRAGFILNLASLVLIAAPAYQTALNLHAATSFQTNEDSTGAGPLEEIIPEATTRISRDELPDIYYIILDEYPRSGSPPEFDNSEFINELESRGFYVAPQARSNYAVSYFSIPSSLNSQYVGEDNERDEHETQQLVEMGDNHALGRVLKALGYHYLHVSSGWFFTKSSRNADAVVEFTPSGRIVIGAEAAGQFSFEEVTRLSSRFTNTFIRTTAFKPFLSHEFSVEDDDPYESDHPFQALAWLEFMKEVASIDGPKFVFAHLMKPHGPNSFDRYGNITLDLFGWHDDHDPTVPEAFYGQLIWLNGQMLEVIDAILDDYDEPPIIVIAGDHGHQQAYRLDILAAFLLPGGGESVVYPSITSVNHFRAILDYYFDLDLGLLEDRVYGPVS